MLELRAAAAAELASREQMPPLIIEWRQPTGEMEPDGMPGNIPCDVQHVDVTARHKKLVFERAADETLEQFQARVKASIPKDGRLWFAIPEPILVSKYRPKIECNPFPGYEPTEFERKYAQRCDAMGNPIPWDESELDSATSKE